MLIQHYFHLPNLHITSAILLPFPYKLLWVLIVTQKQLS
jgi:hypothetical protein